MSDVRDDVDAAGVLDGVASPGDVVRVSWQRIAQSLGVIMLSAAITVSIVVWRDRVNALRQYGYLGVFLISLVGNATVILPAPSLAAVFAVGAVLNPVLVGLAAGVGEALGELTGFLAGYGGRAVVENRLVFRRIEHWVRRYGLLVIFILSVVPNPFFDLAGIAAGMLRVPVWQFLVSCWAGKTVKTMVFALAGARLVDLLL
jgi:uncharacterized membrane protein YdjX (TVP38/TMEM64 family)